MSTWWNGECPKDVAPLIFHICKRKNRAVQQALTDNNWVRDVNLLRFDTTQHFTHFTHSPLGKTTWGGTKSGHSGSNYMEAHSNWRIHSSLSIPGTIHSCSNPKFWQVNLENLGSSILQVFAWLAIQNRLWTADRLAARGCPDHNFVLCACPQLNRPSISSLVANTQSKYGKQYAFGPMENFLAIKDGTTWILWSSGGVQLGC